MSHENHLIVAIHVHERVEKANQVQDILTEYGCYIKTRIGLHETSEEYCSPSGIIVLELVAKEEMVDKMVAKLNTLAAIETKKIVFSH
jgi:hypothetical protein